MTERAEHTAARRHVRILTLLIWSGCTLAVLNLLTAFLLNGFIAFLAAMGTYLTFRVADLMEERRAALSRATGEA